MTQDLPNQEQIQPRPNNRQTRIQLRADTDRMLRDLAFVLKVTQRVRLEIDAEEEAPESPGTRYAESLGYPERSWFNISTE